MRLAKTRRKKQKREASEAGDAEEPGVEMDRVTNGRQSESQEPLTPEHQEVAPHRRRKKKKMQAIDVDEDNLVNGDGEGHHTDGEELTRKNRKTKKPKMAELQYASDLDVQDDDIVTDVQAPVTQISLFSAPTGHSQPVSKVFVERSSECALQCRPTIHHWRFCCVSLCLVTGETLADTDDRLCCSGCLGRFQAADRFDLGGSIGQVEDYMEVRPLWSTRDVAMKVHSGFRVMGLFSHGFLAGYAVWNIITVYVLAGDQLTALPNLLQQYHMLAYPSQSLLYLLLSISIISTFDRVNLAEASAALRSFLTLDPAALSSFLYFAALILSLSQQMASDRINLYPTSNETLWPPGSELQVLQPWIVVNLVVAVLVSLAWIFISTRHDVDFTEEFLLAMDVDGCIRQEEKPEVLA